jgi:hypothetical protein
MATSTTSPTAEPGESGVRFSTLNWVLLAVGAICVIVGYFLLGHASTVAAPLLLVLGYVILLPLGIIL